MKSPFASLNWGVITESRYAYLVTGTASHLTDDFELGSGARLSQLLSAQSEVTLLSSLADVFKYIVTNSGRGLDYVNDTYEDNLQLWRAGNDQINPLDYIGDWWFADYDLANLSNIEVIQEMNNMELTTKDNSYGLGSYEKIWNLPWYVIGYDFQDRPRFNSTYLTSPHHHLTDGTIHYHHFQAMYEQLILNYLMNPRESFENNDITIELNRINKDLLTSYEITQPIMQEHEEIIRASPMNKQRFARPDEIFGTVNNLLKYPVSVGKLTFQRLERGEDSYGNDVNYGVEREYKIQLVTVTN